MGIGMVYIMSMIILGKRMESIVSNYNMWWWIGVKWYTGWINITWNWVFLEVTILACISIVIGRLKHLKYVLLNYHSTYILIEYL